MDDSGNITEIGVQDLTGALFFVCINQSMSNMMGVVTIFCDERPVFLREQANKMYDVFPYFLTKTLIEVPINILAPLIFSAIVYPAMDLADGAGHFFSFLGIVFLIALSSQSFGYFFASVFPQPETAVAVSPIAMMPLIIFGGVMVNVGTLPDWIGWLQWISPIRYGLELFLRNEL